jgi:large subunit ribosomal protein L10
MDKRSRPLRFAVADICATAWLAHAAAKEGVSMDRSQKADAVAALTATFNQVGVVVVTRNLGMTVEQTTALRVKMREAGATFKVSKNSLAKLAIADTDYAGIGDMLVGPVALGTSVDPVAAAKIIVDFAKTNDKLEVIGGSMGAVVLNADGIKALATMPSLDEMRATLIGLVQAPATKIAQVVVAPATKLARVFSVYAEAA